MSFKINHLLKSHTPRIFSNWLPSVCRPEDKLIYGGFKQDDFPRFEGDIKFSVGYKSELTCYGWTFGRVVNGETECTRNPFDEIFYVFSGELIDNETFKRYGDSDTRPGLKIARPDEDNPFLEELNLPAECDLRKDLGYFDAAVIDEREAAFASLTKSLFQNYRPTYTFRDEDYTGSYDGQLGTFKTIKTSIYVAESILLNRIHGKYWSVEKRRDTA